MKLGCLLCLTAYKAQGILVKEIVVTRTIFECPAITTEVLPQETTVNVANNSAFRGQNTLFMFFLLLVIYC